MEKIKNSFKLSWKAESYLFKLMIKQNGLAGIIIVLLGLMERFWWNIGSPFIEKYLIDEFVSIYTNHVITQTVFVLVCAILFGKVLINFLSVISGILAEYVQNKATLYLDKKVMLRIAEVDAAYFDDPNNQDAIRVANESKQVVSDSIGWSVSLVTSIIGFVSAAVIFLGLNPLLGVLFLASYIPGAIIQNKNRKVMRSFSIKNVPENRKKDYYRSLLTSSETAKDIRLYNLTEYFKDKYNNLWEVIRKKRYQIFKKGALQSFAASLLTTIGMIVIVIYGVYGVLHETMTLGEMSLFISLALAAGSSFSLMLNQVIGHWQYCIPEVNNFLDFLQYDQTIEYGRNHNRPQKPIIEFKNVSFRYPSCDDYALKNISFRMEFGEKIALLGINGAGKTTLVKLLLRFYKPESGEILINGINIWEFSEEAYSEIFGTCFQEINKYALTLRENIALSSIKEKDDEARIEYAANASGVDKISVSLEDGYDTDMTRTFNDNGAELSGGQWQKIAISRAYFSNAPVIILDEPSSALDPEAEDEVFRSFKKLGEHRSGILISHRLSSSILVDKIILLENGVIMEIGTHDELIRKNGRYAELYKMQADKYKTEKEMS